MEHNFDDDSNPIIENDFGSNLYQSTSAINCFAEVDVLLEEFYLKNRDLFESYSQTGNFEFILKAEEIFLSFAKLFLLLIAVLYYQKKKYYEYKGVRIYLLLDKYNEMYGVSIDPLEKCGFLFSWEHNKDQKKKENVFEIKNRKKILKLRKTL